MEKLCLILSIILSITVLIQCSSLSSTLTLLEQHRIAQSLLEPPRDLQSAYYTVTALKAIGKQIHDVEGVCQLAIANLKKDDAESLMQLSFVVYILKCKNVPVLSIADLVTENIEPVKFAHLIIAMSNLGYKVDDSMIKKFVEIAKENDTPNSAAASFYAAGVLPDHPDLKPIVSMVEDIVAQADEVNGMYLQFEGGLSVTSKVVAGIVKLSDQQGQSLLKEGQAVKFSKYLVSRKYVHSLKDIHYLLVALGALANNQQLVPVVVSSFGSSLITKENPSLKVRITNLLDQSIPDVRITATSFASQADDSLNLIENVELAKKGDADDFIVIDSEIAKGFVAAHSFSLDIMNAQPTRGLYKCKLDVSIKAGNKQLALHGPFEVKVKVLAKIVVEDVEIGVGDKDQTSPNKNIKLNFPDKMSVVLEADYHQKIVMTFNLKDSSNQQLVTTHQTFIRLVNEATGQEIFFVAEADSNDHYKFTLDVDTTGKESFNNLSGKYKMALIVGDNAMQVPISWNLGDVVLTFSGQAKKTKRQERITEPRPIIEHTFRVPEKRPAKIVSTAFTLLVLSPILIMIAMWAKIGANVSNLNITIATVFFHVGLACIFVLYYMFWTHLDMFHTLKLLILIGGITFLGGNKMLADMAAAKYKA